MRKKKRMQKEMTIGRGTAEPVATFHTSERRIHGWS
jgi:hypothetical protein